MQSLSDDQSTPGLRAGAQIKGTIGHFSVIQTKKGKLVCKIFISGQPAVVLQSCDPHFIRDQGKILFGILLNYEDIMEGENETIAGRWLQVGQQVYPSTEWLDDEVAVDISLEYIYGIVSCISSDLGDDEVMIVTYTKHVGIQSIFVIFQYA